MGTTNEFERDLGDQAGLKRPGRIDLRVLQNTPDAGDGSPGVQRCFRNYLHEGGMEKDLELVGYGIKGTSVDINNIELQQLSNIGSVTINGTQWGYVGGADQSVKQADSPTFNGLTINGNITITGNVDSVDISAFKSSFDAHKASTGEDHSYINQDLRTSFSPTFVGLTLSANLITTSTIDSVDVGDLKTAFDTHKASTGIDHTYINQSVITTTSPTFVGLTLSADLVTTSTVDGVDVSAIKLNSMPSAADGNIDANTQKIINVVDPTLDQDAATKKYVDNYISLITLSDVHNAVVTHSGVTNPSYINDNNVSTKPTSWDMNDYIILDFEDLKFITQFRLYEDWDEVGGGEVEIYYYTYDDVWVKIATKRLTVDGWCPWTFFDASFITDKIKLVCTDVDTSTFVLEIHEIELR